MKKSLIVILIVLLLAAIALYFSVGMKTQQPDTATIDPDYVEYKDQTNFVSLAHHKDWQAQSSYGFIRVTPKMVSTEFESLQVTMQAPQAVMQDLKFTTAPNSVRIGEYTYRVVDREMTWKDGSGKPLDLKTVTSYYHLALEGQNVVIEVKPGTGVNPAEKVRKTIESIKFGVQ